jgi:hypothetical protein
MKAPLLLAALAGLAPALSLGERTPSGQHRPAKGAATRRDKRNAQKKARKNQRKRK